MTCEVYEVVLSHPDPPPSRMNGISYVYTARESDKSWLAKTLVSLFCLSGIVSPPFDAVHRTLAFTQISTLNHASVAAVIRASCTLRSVASLVGLTEEASVGLCPPFGRWRGMKPVRHNLFGFLPFLTHMGNAYGWCRTHHALCPMDS